MFGRREGWWRCWSEKDPRWNMDGRGFVGLLTIPPACARAIEEKKKELAEEPPDDLRYEYLKD